MEKTTLAKAQNENENKKFDKKQLEVKKMTLKFCGISQTKFEKQNF